MHSASGSQRKQLDLRIEMSKVLWIRGGHPLVSTPCADDHVRIHHVGSTAGREQPADVGGVDPAQRNQIGGRLADKACQPYLTLGPTDRLSEGARRHGHASPSLGGASE